MEIIFFWTWEVSHEESLLPQNVLQVGSRVQAGWLVWPFVEPDAEGFDIQVVAEPSDGQAATTAWWHYFDQF